MMRGLDFRHTLASSTLVGDETSFWSAYDHACCRADYVLLIAPECDGWLLRMVRAAEQMGSHLLSPGSEFVRWASDKHATAELLRGQQARAPAGMRCRELLETGGVPPLEYPLVAKPMDGAGSSGICVIHHRAELQTLIDSGKLRDHDRCERLHPGRAASITWLCGPRAACSLQPCWQNLSDDGTYQYLGGAIMLEEQMIGRARRLVAPLRPLLRTTVGLVGVDFVLGDDPTGRQDVIIEVNPRVTTSYVGLRRYHGCNLAQAMIDIAAGRAINIRPSGKLTMQWLAVDIGGANIKVADGKDFALTRPFPLWKAPSQLTLVLREVIAQSPANDHLAISMTGELADCFATKTEGVLQILAAVEQASDRHARVYTTDGRWLALAAARRRPLACDGSNWHASARFAARLSFTRTSEAC